MGDGSARADVVGVGEAMRIGAQESVAGGLAGAFERAAADGAESVQIFTKSSRQWAAKPITEADAKAFRAAHAKSGLPTIVHASYLVNLGSEALDVRAKSIDALRDEVLRCEQLGLPSLVLHPGSNPDSDRGLSLIAAGLRQVFTETAGCKAGILLETMAGQGSTLGHRLEHLAALLGDVDAPDRLGTCLDTCHLFAAGYDLGAEGYDATMDAFGRVVGFGSLRAVHLNDSVKALGSRVDRHANIGDGLLGEGPFARLVRDPRLAGLPAVLETPEGRYREEIALLRSLRDGQASHPDVGIPAAVAAPESATSQRDASRPASRRSAASHRTL